MLIELLNYSYFSLFLIVALGFVLGRMKIFGVSLDISAVIFVALLFGHLGVVIPKELGTFGLVLFIFTIGMQAGPGFIDTFRSKGSTLIAITLVIVVSATATAYGAKVLFGIDTPTTVGLLAGALTSTPGLAVAIDTTNSPMASIAYGVAYPFGVISVIVFVKILPKLLGVDPQSEVEPMVSATTDYELTLHDGQVVESLLITKQSIVNRRLGDLHLQRRFGSTVTRIRRSGVVISPSPDLLLKFGDKLTCVGERDGLNGMAKLFGNDEKRLSDTDFFPIAMGIVIGVVIGKITISIPGLFSLSLGLTGGVLVSALILGAIGKTGPILWTMSGASNQLLRQLGLLLFLAEVGSSAGRTLVSAFAESGFTLFFAGVAITVVPMILAVVVGRYLLKVSLLDLIGAITGGMTSTPGLAAADSIADSNIPNVAYAAVYPIAMVLIILFIKLLSVV